MEKSRLMSDLHPVFECRELFHRGVSLGCSQMVAGKTLVRSIRLPSFPIPSSISYPGYVRSAYIPKPHPNPTLSNLGQKSFRTMCMGTAKELAIRILLKAFKRCYIG